MTSFQTAQSRERLAQHAANWRAYRHARRFRFKGRFGDTYYWERAISNDSRVEQITCNVQWFWNGGKA